MVVLSVGLIPATIATVHLACQYVMADNRYLPSPPPVEGQYPQYPPSPPVSSAAAPMPDASDQQLARFLNSRTDMVVAIDPSAIDWDAIDSTRDKFLHDAGVDPKSIDHGPIVPTFAHRLTVAYRQWTGDFTQAGGIRMYIVSQVGPRNPGAFDAATFKAGADPSAMADLYTPISFTAQHVVEAGIIDHMVVSANHQMVTALAHAKPQPRPDLMEALAASTMPVRQIWIPSQCRLANRPTTSNVSIDNGTSAVFQGKQWDNAKWAVLAFTPPPNDALEAIVKCTDAESAQALAKWIVTEMQQQKTRPPRETEPDVRAARKVNVENDLIRVDCDPSVLERDWFTSNPSPFNLLP
jgi:hypothetical protein